MASILVMVIAILNLFWTHWVLALFTIMVVLIVWTISLTTYIATCYLECLWTLFTGIVRRKFAENLWRSLSQRWLQNVVIAYVRLLDGMTDFLILLSLLSKQNYACFTFVFFVCFWFALQTQVSTLFHASHYLWDYLLQDFR